MTMSGDLPRANRGTFRILGVRISVVDMPAAVDQVVAAAGLPVPSFVLVREVPSLMLAAERDDLRRLHEEAELVVPDGMPLVWIGRLRGLGRRIGRVAGADLLDAVCERSIATGQTHFFYGGKPGIANEMVRRLTARFPGLKVVGCFSPPLRNIDGKFIPDRDILAELQLIRNSGADFVWVGLSSPKQEFWMASCMPYIGHGTFFGVGAAFDFHSGAIQRAPLWMQRASLEWLHRLISEPRRLWRRYLLLAPLFVIAVLYEEVRLRFGRMQTCFGRGLEP